MFANRENLLGRQFEGLTESDRPLPIIVVVVIALQMQPFITVPEGQGKKVLYPRIIVIRVHDTRPSDRAVHEMDLRTDYKATKRRHRPGNRLYGGFADLIAVDDLDAAEALALELGAARLEGGGDNFRVFADPAGHPFCLAQA